MAEERMSGLLLLTAGKRRIAEGIYTSGQIDVPEWAAKIESDYLQWCEAEGSEASPRR